jgi:ATP-dependent Lon protease
MDDLDQKLNEIFPGCVVRKDLLHQIKKGTNVPSFVLEFLLAKFCATDDPDEIQAGIAAVIETIQKNYVRPGRIEPCPVAGSTEGQTQAHRQNPCPVR